MKSKRGSRLSPTLSSPLIAVTVGILCLACYIQISYSASISASASTSTTTTSKRPIKITSLKTTTKTVKPRLEVQPGRMKASDIKACISKAFCEVNSASDRPNYAVNQEFFDLMNQINALSDEELDSGSTSVEYDDDDDDEDEDDTGSSEESSSERIRGYPPPPHGYGRYGRNMLKNETTIEGELNFKNNGTSSAPKKLKSLKKKGKRTNKKKSKLSKKYVNGTLSSVPKRRRSRLETKEEKAEKDAYVTRKQREMGQVNDLAALIRISADIGLTLRSPRKCRTLFNKCRMSHDQIVDLFNQTLIAVTTPQSGTSPADSMTSLNSLTVPTTKRAKTQTTSAAAVPMTTTLDSEPISTVILDNKIIVRSTPAPTQTTVTTLAPATSTPEDANRSSKSRHEFSEEDVEYMTDTEIQPVHTYALFVNDAAEETGKTQEEVTNVQETFKKYANAFPAETPLPKNLPSLRKRSNKKNLKKVGGKGRSSHTKSILRRKSSSEEDEDDEEDDDPEASTSVENNNNKSGFRIENPYPGYRIQDDEKDLEPEDDNPDSAEPVSTAKESNEGILPPLVQKERPKMKEEDDEEEDDEVDSDESLDADETEPIEGKGFGGNGKAKGKTQNANKKSKQSAKPGKDVVALEDEESSEEDEIEPEHADDDQSPPPWTPVYQMYMHDKHKQGHKKKQKGPYKGGEGAYGENVPHHGGLTSHKSKLSQGLSSLGLGGLGSKKPWGGSSGSQELGGAGPSSHSHEGIYSDSPYPHHQSHHAGGPPAPPYGAGPLGGSQETGGVSEQQQKPGFFQSILSWFSGGSKAPEPSPSSHQIEGPYGSPSSHLPYGSNGSPGGPSHNGYGGHSGSNEHVPHKPPHSHNAGGGAPWPSQPDPAGVGHFGQGYRYRYKKPTESSEEDSLEEILEDEPIKMKKRNKKRRYNGRSDSIIASPPKKTVTIKKSTGSTKNGPPPPVVIHPKESKPSGKSTPTGDFDKLIQADGGLTSGGNNGNKKKSSPKTETKRTKKAAVKPKKKSEKPAERAQPHRSSMESAEDDDEAFSSEELYNQQVAKLKSGANSKPTASSSTSSSSNSNNNGNSGGGISIVSLGPTAGLSKNKPKKSSHETHSSSQKSSNNNNSNNNNNGGSFPSYFESMFGTEEKDKYKIKGNDDGSLLFGFDSLSSTLHATPLDVPAVTNSKPKSSYKINKSKKKQKKGNTPPVQFNNKEVAESSEEDDKKK